MPVILLAWSSAYTLIAAAALLGLGSGYLLGRIWLGRRSRGWYVKASELDTQNLELRTKLSNMQSAGNDAGALKVKIAAIERENNQLELRLRMYREDIGRLKTMVASLETLNNQLQAEKNGNKKGKDKQRGRELFELREEQAEQVPDTEPRPEFLQTLPMDEDAEPEDEFTRIAGRRTRIDWDRIGYATEADADDLRRINGIGASVARKLNNLGVFTYRQIANFTADDMVLVNEAIEFFPGRILKDNWVGQAKKLLEKAGK